MKKENFTVFIRRDRHSLEKGMEMSGHPIPGDFEHFNRAWNAARKMVTAGTIDWERVVITIERKTSEEPEI